MANYNPFTDGAPDDVGDVIDPAHLILSDPKGAQAARAERRAGRAGLEDLRGRIPGTQSREPTDEERQGAYDTAYQEAYQRVLAASSGRPGITSQMARRMAEQAAQQAGDSAREALKTVSEQDLSGIQLDPEMFADPEDVNFGGYEASTLGRSNMWGANADPNSIAAQEQALRGFQDIANQGGLTAIDRARIAEARAGEEQWLRGQRGATLANMQARGLGGSGAEMASLFEQQQSSANRNALSGMQTEALAQQRAMDALGMSGDMGTQMRGDSFGEARDRAQGQDAFDTFNAGVTNDSRRFSADVENQENSSNVGARREQSRGNTNLENQARGYNIEIPWRQYGADAAITGDLAGESFNQAAVLQGQAIADENRGRQAAGTVVGAYLGGPGGAAAGSQAAGGGGGYTSPAFNPSVGYNSNYGDGGQSKDKTDRRYKPQGVKC